MLPPLLLLFYLIGQMSAKKPPDVECLVMNLEYVQCSWNKSGTPKVNYTFSSWFEHSAETNCSEYLLENGINIGCNRAYEDERWRFFDFYTVLKHGSEVYEQEHEPVMKVKLNPPANLTVKNESDSNLWFYWNHTIVKCVESQVRYRKNNNNIWERSNVAAESQNYSINFSSSNSRYELQVRSTISKKCGGLVIWSDWSEPVVWSFNNSTDTSMLKESLSVWTPVLYAVGAITLILLVLLFLKHERFRIIFIPVVPKPSLNSPDMKDWFQFPKGLRKEDFKANYTDQACPVCEYTYVSSSDSSCCNTQDLAGDYDDCSVVIAENESEEPSSPVDSSTVSSEEEQQVSVKVGFIKQSDRSPD